MEDELRPFGIEDGGRPRPAPMSSRQYQLDLILPSTRERTARRQRARNRPLPPTTTSPTLSNKRSGQAKLQQQQQLAGSGSATLWRPSRSERLLSSKLTVESPFFSIRRRARSDSWISSFEHEKSMCASKAVWGSTKLAEVLDQTNENPLAW